MIIRNILGCVIAVACILVVVGTPVRAAQQEGYDLEDVNFAFDEKGVIDALPQIQRLADLLNANAELLLTIKGHADWKGPGPYNERLSLHRADAVKQTLMQKGISGDRITVRGYGASIPAAPNESREGRWINRRVIFDVYRIVDGQPDYFYRDNKFIKGVGEPAVVIGPDVRIPETRSPAVPDTGADRIIDRLDQIEKNLDALRTDLKAAPPAEASAPLPARMPRLLPEDVQGLLAGSLGSDTDGHLAGRVEGRIFWPFNENLAVQAGMTGLLSKDRDEYRFDLGLVGRRDAFQAGLFVQGLAADIDGMEDTGAVSQVAATLGYRTPLGIVSVYGTHPLNKEDVVRVDKRFIGPDLETTETYLRVRKTYGVAADLTFADLWYAEGSVGYVSGHNAKVSGHLQLGHLLGNGDLSVFVRSELNNGRLVDDMDGRILAGLEWGSWRRRTAEDGGKVVPMPVPALHYDVMVRTSMLYADVNFAPVVAIDVSSVKGEVPLTVDFHGSAHDPDGTVESLRWDFDDGTTAEGADVSHTFGSAGLYRVILTATDNKGVTGQAEVVITAGHNLVPVVSIEASTVDGIPPLNVTFRGIAYDPDGTVASYHWDFGDGQTGSGADVSHTYGSAGVYRVVLTATDNQGGEGRADVVITVGGGNTPPIADAGRDQNLEFERDMAGQICIVDPEVCEILGITPAEYTITLRGDHSTDLDGDQLLYRWEQIGGPPGELRNSDSAEASFAIPTNQNGTYVFRLIVSDGRGGVDDDTVETAVQFFWRGWKVGR